MTQRRTDDHTLDSRAQTAPAEVAETKVRLVTCPQCGGDAVYAASNPYRPFCSQRCKNIDFGAWADESFRVPDKTDPDSLSIDDPTHLQ